MPLAAGDDCKDQDFTAYKRSDSRGKGSGRRAIAEPMADFEDIYSERVLQLSANMPRAGKLLDADATASAHSKLCGSRITIGLKMERDTVTDYAQDVRACLLGQTAAAVMGANVVGSTAGELRAVGAQMRRMLKEGGEPPSGRWSDLAVLEIVREYKARHASTLLVFDAVEDAIAQIEKRRATGASLG